MTTASRYATEEWYRERAHHYWGSEGLKVSDGELAVEVVEDGAWVDAKVWVDAPVDNPLAVNHG